MTDAVGTDSCIRSTISRSCERRRVFARVQGHRQSRSNCETPETDAATAAATHLSSILPSIDHHRGDMSSVLASVLRRILCRSSLQTAATHPSLRLLFFLVISAIFLFCCMSMLRSDERHYLSHSRRRYQLNQVTSNNTSRSRSFHYVGPVPLSEHHRSVNSDSAEILGVLLKSGSTRTSGELGPGDGLRSTTAQPRNDSTNTHY